MICASPDVARTPAQPSPVTPPEAVHEVAAPLRQVNVIARPVSLKESLALRKTPLSISKPSEVRAPVLSGSSSDFSVTGFVVLVGSAFDSQTADSELYSAVAVSAVGAGGEAAGQKPSEPEPLWRDAMLATPTNR